MLGPLYLLGISATDEHVKCETNVIINILKHFTSLMQNMKTSNWTRNAFYIIRGSNVYQLFYKFLWYFFSLFISLCFDCRATVSFKV